MECTGVQSLTACAKFTVQYRFDNTANEKVRLGMAYSKNLHCVASVDRETRLLGSARVFYSEAGVKHLKVLLERE